MPRTRKKPQTWKRLGTAMMVVACIVIMYPLLTNFNAWYQQTVLKEQIVKDSSSDKSRVGPASESQNTQPGDAESASPGRSTPIVPWALLEIPRIGLSTVVIQGTSQENLARAPGWYTSTALPGKGNTAIAGHRTMYGGPFQHLVNLEPGDELILTYQNSVFRYRVEEVQTIDSNDWNLLQPCGYPALTLTTCTVEGQDKRTAVRARLETGK